MHTQAVLTTLIAGFVSPSISLRRTETDSEAKRWKWSNVEGELTMRNDGKLMKIAIVVGAAIVFVFASALLQYAYYPPV